MAKFAMKVSKESDLSRLIWLTALCLVLAGTAVLFYLFPEISSVSPLPRPFSPSVSYLIRDAHHLVGRDDSAELSAVRSPTLISLPIGIIFPYFTREQINHITPPLKASPGRSFFLDMMSTRQPDMATVLQDRGHHRVERSRVFLPFKGSRVFDKPRLSGKHQVRMELSEGLRGKTIDHSCLALDKWTKADGPWAVTLYVHFDETGKPVQVFLESRASDNTLNAEVIRNLYQCRLSEPGEPCEGRVTLWFSGP